MAKVALRKAEKQLETHNTEELQTQVEQLRKTAEQAKQTLDKATAKIVPAASKATEDTLKRLKIADSMARVTLSKAEKQLEIHGTDELKQQVAQLSKAAEHAKQALADATPAAEQTAKPSSSKAVKPEPSAAEQALKKAKIAVAMKRAAVRKAERSEADADTLTALQAELSQAEQDLAKLNQSEPVDV